MKKIIIVLLLLTMLISNVNADSMPAYKIEGEEVPNFKLLKDLQALYDEQDDYLGALFYCDETGLLDAAQYWGDPFDETDVPNNQGFLIHGARGKFLLKPFLLYHDLSMSVGEVEHFSDAALAMVKTDYGKAGMKYAKVVASSQMLRYEPAREGWYNYAFITLKNGHEVIGMYGSEKDTGYKDPVGDIFANAKTSVSNVLKYDAKFDEYNRFGEPCWDYENFVPQMNPIRLNWYNFDANHFVDIEGHWAKNSINKCFELDLINGVGDNKFDPDAPLTRAHVAQILYNFAKKYNYDIDYVKQNISDISVGDWYAEAIDWAVTKGAFKLENGVASPNKIDRRIWACEGLYDFIDTYKIPMPYWNLAKYFPDLEQQYPNKVQKIRALQKAEIISGMDENNFAPDQPLTRAQMAKILDSFAYANYKMSNEDWSNQFECPDYLDKFYEVRGYR